MGSGKKQTVGYHYEMLFHYGLCRGPVDAFLEFRGGDRTAWVGRLVSSDTIDIDMPNLWGGEEKEGGIVGPADVMFGEADQAPSAYLQSELTPQISGLRGKFTFLFKGGRFGTAPYPKSVAFKVERIKAGWDNDEPWYPEKAAIPYGVGAIASINQILRDTPWRYLYTESNHVAGASAEDFDDSGWAVGVGPFGNTYYPDVNTALPGGVSGSQVWTRKTISQIPPGAAVTVTVDSDDGAYVWWNGQQLLNATVGHAVHVVAPEYVADVNQLAVQVKNAAPVGDGANIYSGVDISWEGGAFVGYGMNPAHILYESLTSQHMLNEPVENIDEASFIAAADRFYAEGFALCTTYDHSRESIEQFQERIQTVVGATLSQSRIDGRYRLDVIRGDYDPETLPILSDADILEFTREPTSPFDSVNEVVVEWYDPTAKEKRTTTPLQSLGAIMASGAVMSETAKYYELPSEELALRVAARDLKNKSSPNNRFQMTTTRRKTSSWRAGTFFRLQAPRRGIADMICMVAEISAGTLRSGAMTMTAIQDVAHLPDATYVVPQPGVDPNPNAPPEPVVDQLAIEAPYMEIAGTVPSAQLALIAPEAGYLLALAAPPGAGMNFRLFTKAGAEAYVDQGEADWTPTALVVEGAEALPTETAFTLSDGSNLSRITIGTAALWGSEIVRVDAWNAGTGAITLARGVGDTVPQLHEPGERIWFYDLWAATDQREYLVGEEAFAKAATRTSSAELHVNFAPAMSVEMDQRAARPYPPANVKVAGSYAPTASVGTTVEITLAHRDRILQADQRVAWGEASVGPEPGTEYQARYYDATDDTLLHTAPAFSGAAASHAFDFTGAVVLELHSVRDELESWQPAVVRFFYEGAETLLAYEDGAIMTTESGVPLHIES
jgi:hypothetical protein